MIYEGGKEVIDSANLEGP